MTTKNRRRGRLPPFIALIKATMATPAWRAMSPGARLLNIELRGRLRNDHLNNGKVFLSCRYAAKAIGATSRSVVRWYAENEHYGFLRKTSEGFLGSDGRGIAAHYRFTEFPHGTHPPTRDFEKWDGVLFAYTPRGPRRKKQNPVSLRDTPRVPEGYIRKVPEGKSVCVPEGYIGEPPRCVPEGYISRTTSPQRSGELSQGSSTARAPAQAGDAGSSPAPVTYDERGRSDGLMSYVAGVIAKAMPDPRLPWSTPLRHEEAALWRLVSTGAEERAERTQADAPQPATQITITQQEKPERLGEPESQHQQG